MRRHVVEQGECLSSIAYQYGFAVDTVWKYADNASLREQRSSPYLLQPGDVVVIPDRRSKGEQCANGQTHKFKRKDVPERLKLVLRDREGKPRANLAYVLHLEGEDIRGTTDGEGRIDRPVRPDAREARLEFDGEHIELDLGHLAPASSDEGAYARLAALGLLDEAEDADDDEQLRQAVRVFQRQQKLDVTGALDDATRKKLESAYGC